VGPRLGRAAAVDSVGSMRTLLQQDLPALPRDTRDTLFLLAVIAVVTLPLAMHMPRWSAAFVVATLLWRARLAWRALPLPGRAPLVVAMLLALGMTWAEHGTIAGRTPGVTLVMLLLALKTLEVRARRDALVVFFLGFFVLLANFFYAQSIALTLVLVLGLLGLLTALINAHMHVGYPPLRQSARAALRLMLWGAPVMAALFVLFPRVAPLWGMPADELTGRTGLTDSMRVGSVANLALDSGIALRLRFDTPGGQPPPANTLYFRGPVLSLFDGSEWHADPVSANWEQPLLQVGGEAVRYQMLIEPSQGRWLTLLDATPAAPVLPPHMGRARMSAQLQWMSWRPITDTLRLEVESYPQFRYGPLTPVRSLQRHTRLPPGSNPRTQALAAQLLAQVQPLEPTARAGALVRAALERLRSGNYSYTLEPEVVDQNHSADDFWFDSQEGFCEHIASAFVVLLRAAGVPARIVLGYQGGERNPVDGYWTVRHSDAHAWAEVWLHGQGWVRVDPTGAVAPGRVGQFQRLQTPRGAVADVVGGLFGDNWLQTLRALHEALDNGWKQWVLNYTQTSQTDLLRALGWRSSPSWVDLLRLLGLGAAAVAVLWLLRVAQRARQRDPWLRLMERARAQLHRLGIAAEASATPRTLAARVRTHCAANAPAHAREQAQALCRWLLHMEQHRYASAEHAPPLPALRKQWRALQWPRPKARP